MDANDLGRTVPRLREDSPGRQMASLPAKLPDVLIYCSILVRLPVRLLFCLTAVCKACRNLILGRTVRRLREDPPRRQIASPPVQLPDDLLYLCILPRLPFRSLFRVAVVCKGWRHLILGDPAFARAQARCPSPASTVLARFHRGRLEFLSSAAAVAPPDASLSFLPVVADEELLFCSTTSGLLCLMACEISGGRARASSIFVVNPATRAFRSVPYACNGPFTPCLAYDPSTVHLDGYHIVVPAKVTTDQWRFWIFSSGASSGGGGWRVSGAAVRLTPNDSVVLDSKPLYLGGRAYWLCERGGVVWHEARADASGASTPIPGGEARRCVQSKKELVSWHGRIGIVSASATTTGLAVWALSSSSSPSPAAQWEMVHARSWDEIPGVARPASFFMWSVVPAGMDGGGEEALGLAVRTGIAYRVVDGASGEEKEVLVSRRDLLRYDVRTGATAAVVAGKEVNADFEAVFGYHSSMAPLS